MVKPVMRRMTIVLNSAAMVLGMCACGKPHG